MLKCYNDKFKFKADQMLKTDCQYRMAWQSNKIDIKLFSLIILLLSLSFFKTFLSGISKLINLYSDTVYWNEIHFDEKGRYVICSSDTPGKVTQWTPSDFNARSTVHEYGGQFMLQMNNGFFIIRMKQIKILREVKRRFNLVLMFQLSCFLVQNMQNEEEKIDCFERGKWLCYLNNE